MDNRTNNSSHVERIISSTRAHKLIHNLPYDELGNEYVIKNQRGNTIIFPKFSKEEMEKIAITQVHKLNGKQIKTNING